MKFKVYDEVFEKVPNLCIGFVVGYGIDNSKVSEEIYGFFEKEMAIFSKSNKDKNVKELESIIPYRETFLELGINPNKYTSSIEAISKRISKGGSIPSINPVVDLVNYISLKYTLPMGAHDLDALTEEIAIRFSDEGDKFTPLGTEEIEILPSGELVYSDVNQIRTRRWIWRQSNIGKINENSKNIFFPVDGFSDRNEGSVKEAVALLETLIKEHFGCETKVGFVDSGNREFSI